MSPPAPVNNSLSPCILIRMVDLHTHSDASDGELSPAALIDLAAERGLQAIALTDHDTMAGLTEAADRAKKHSIRFIPGVETEVNFSPGEFHLLGLGLKIWPQGPLEEFLSEIRRRRENRNKAMIELMRDAGLDITLEELDKMAGGEVIGRMHFARWLMEAGKARTVPEVFEKYLGSGCPYHVPKHRPELQDAIDAIHAAGGKAVVAHPLSLWISWGRLGKAVAEWKEMGLDGIEAYHSGASKREASRFAELAAANGMIVSGGSDFHGTGRPDRKLGRSAAKMKLGEEILEPFV